MISDVFGLNTVYERQTERTWTEDPNFGYFVGGESGSGDLSRIDRFDVSTETPSVISPLTRTRSRNDALSSNFYGYTAGDPASCTIERLDFSSDVSQLSTNSIPTNYGLGASVSNNSYGYFSGGDRPARSCLIDRLEFSNDTVSRPASALPFVRRNHHGTENDSYGYFGGGIQPGTTCVITRLDFSNDNVSNPGNNFSQGVNEHATASSNTYGYYVSGPDTNIRKLDFSTEVSSISTPFVKQNDKFASFSTNKYGYFGGGQGLFSDVDRLDFSNDTSTSLGAPSNFLPSAAGARDFLAAFSSGKAGRSVKHLRKTSGTDVDGRPISSTYGYFVGGKQTPVPSPTLSNQSEKFDYSTETIAFSPTTNISQARHFIGSFSSRDFGYFGGGYIGGPTFRSCRIDRLDFSADVSFRPTVDFSVGNSASAGVATNEYGYWYAGRITTINRCTIERLQIATETLSTLDNTFSRGTERCIGVRSPGYGYFAGGSPGPSTINRLDLFSETTDNPSTTLPQGRRDLGAVYTSDFGYFGGGYNDLCRIDRLDFSTETTSNPPAALSQAREGVAAFHNTNYGYFGGGTTSLPLLTRIDRLEFSNDTPTNLPVGLLEGRYEHTAVFN